MKYLVLAITATLFITGAKTASAKEVTCSSNYGEAVVCGVETPQTPVVPTALGDDIHPIVIIGSLFMGSSVFAYFSRKLSRTDS